MCWGSNTVKVGYKEYGRSTLFHVPVSSISTCCTNKKDPSLHDNIVDPKSGLTVRDLTEVVVEMSQTSEEGERGEERGREGRRTGLMFSHY